MVKVFITILFCIVSSFSFGQAKPKEKPRILFILDASYSMNRKWGQELMWNIAKKTLADFATVLDKKYGAEMALRVYGHQFDASFNNCTDTKLEVPMAFDNSGNIKALLSVLRYNGTTPIAYSMSFAGSDFKGIKGRNNIILITDGEESCGGDPCKTSRVLQENGITLKPVVIGMNLSEFGLLNIKCIGDVSNAKTPEEFKILLDKAMDKVLDKTTFQINLLDSKGRPTETDVPIVFTTPSDKPISNIYHTLNSNKSPDTLFFNDLIEFNAKILTIPSIQQKINLNKFEHNIIEIPAAQGFLDVSFETANSDVAKVLIRKSGTTIHVAETNSSTKLLADQYQVEVLTLPILKYKANIEGEKATKITIPNPGTLVLEKTTVNVGGIFMEENGKLKKIYSIAPNAQPEMILIQPGKYKLIYKATNYPSIYDTIEKSFEMVSGSKVTLKLQ